MNFPKPIPDMFHDVGYIYEDVKAWRDFWLKQDEYEIVKDYQKQLSEGYMPSFSGLIKYLKERMLKKND